MLERLVAAIIVIGAVLWGASMLASPGDDADVDAPREAREGPDEAPIGDVDEPILPQDEDDDEDEKGDEGEGEREGKRKRGKDGGD